MKKNFTLIFSITILFLLMNSKQSHAQINAINTGTMYISASTIVSDEGSFTTSAAGSTQNNGDFYLKGDWIHNGSYPAGTGKVTFWGTTAQNISGTTGTTFYNAEVNKPSNGVTINVNTTVSNILTLTNGPVDLNSNSVTISNSATAGIGYTNGVLISEKTTNLSKVQWNIGSTTGSHVIPYAKFDGTFIPLTLNLTAGTIGNVTTSTYPSAPNNTPYPVTPNAVANMNGPSGSDNSANVVDRFWQIDRSGAGGTLTVTFTYADAEAPANGETGLIAQRYSGGWLAPVSSQSNSTALNTVTTPGVITFGPYTLSQSSNPLPVELLTFEAELNSQKKVDLTWTTASETNNDFFTIERSKDLNKVEFVSNVNGAGNSTSINEYAAIDKNPSNGVSYYRLKQTDFNGKIFYSGWRTVNNTSENVFTIINAYLIPSANEFVVAFTIPENGEIKLNLVNAIGELIFSNKLSAAKGLNTFRFTKNKDFSPGVYGLNAIYQNEMKSVKLMRNN